MAVKKKQGSTKEPIILITNDDSIHAPGIRALVEAARGLGKIVVVAPDKPQSGMGHAITIGSPLRLHKMHLFEDVESYSCSGTPVDCVKLAVDKVLHRKPDICLSGINHGANHSINVIYSGTMSAALEASIESIPSIGFSLLDLSIEADFTAATHYARLLVEQMLKKPIAEPHLCLNVNIPKGELASIKGIKICRQAYAKYDEEFDENIISLHNVSQRIKGFIYSSPVYSKFTIIENDNINYTQCIQRLLKYLTQKNATTFLFYQDDTFSNELTNTNFNDFKDCILNYKFPLLNISYKLDYLKFQPGSTWIESNKKIVFEKPTFKIFDTTTQDFVQSGLWSMDDSSFICNLQTLQNIYDKNYLTSFTDIWSAEYYLQQKFATIAYPRYIASISFVKNYNVIGPNSQPSNMTDLILKLNCNEEDFI